MCSGGKKSWEGQVEDQDPGDWLAVLAEPLVQVQQGGDVVVEEVLADARVRQPPRSVRFVGNDGQPSRWTVN